jgi:hypothetical protein
MSKRPSKGVKQSKEKDKAPKPKKGVQRKAERSLEEEILRRYATKKGEPSPEKLTAPEVTLARETETPDEAVIRRQDAKFESENGESDRALREGEQLSETGSTGRNIVTENATVDVTQPEGGEAPMGPIETDVVLPASSEEVVATLRKLREDVGQISELSAEEGNIVGAFSIAFLKTMEPLTKTLTVDVSILPREMGPMEKANIIPKGELVVLFRDGRMVSMNLKDPENRDLLIKVVSNVVPKFNALITQRRSKIEERIAFLSDVTRELQTIADSLTTVG